jgi:amino acid transporter
MVRSAVRLAEAEHPGLGANSLKARDALAISVAILVPGMAMLLNVPGVAAVAGASTQLALLLAGCGACTLAFVVVGFTRRMAGAGCAYTYLSRGIGQGGGFLAGWLYAFGVLCFAPMTMTAVVYLICDLLDLDTALWSPVFVIGMVWVVALALVRVAVTTRVQLVLGVITVLAVDVAVTAGGGPHGSTWAPLMQAVPGGFAGVFDGLILGITSYIAFEMAATRFREETANPRRSIPLAVLISVGLATVFYLWTTYSLSTGLKVRHGANSATLQTIGSRFVGPSLGVLVELGALVLAFVVCVGCATAATRTTHPMARQRVLPARLAMVAVAVVSTVLTLLVGYGLASPDLGASPAMSVYYFVATVGTVAVIVIYLGLCAAVARYLRRPEQRAGWLPRMLASALALTGHRSPSTTGPLTGEPAPANGNG